MGTKRRPSVVMIALLWACAVAAENQQFTCTNGAEKRVITVVYEVPNQNVPCRVDYEKPQSLETLWTAKSAIGFCEEKANAFLEKQRGWGFSCEQAKTSE